MWITTVITAMPFLFASAQGTLAPPSATQNARSSEAPAFESIKDGAEVCGADASGDRVKLTLVTPDIVNAAQGFLKTFFHYPLGTECVRPVDGSRYVFVLERHYHPPGFEGAPTGWHKGVTVYALR